MADRLQEEVRLKNEYLSTLDGASPNAYFMPTQATQDLGQVASIKYQQSSPGQLPFQLIVDEKAPWSKKDWMKVVGLISLCLLIFYLLLKSKIITI